MYYALNINIYSCVSLLTSKSVTTHLCIWGDAYTES